MRTKYIISLILMACIGFIVACNNVNPKEPTPPTIHYGEDICELCGMIISEENHAAAYLTKDGHGHVFDDIGDMFKSYQDNKEEVTALFVHNYEDKLWMRAELTYYVVNEEIHTPMLSGIAAFATEMQAKEFAKKYDSEALSFDEMKELYEK